MNKYKNYYEVCKKRKAPIIFGIILLIITAIIAINLPFLMNKAMDALFNIKEGFYKEFFQLFSLYVVFYCSQLVIDYLTTIIFKKVGNSNSAEIAEDIVHKTINCEKRIPSQIKISNTVVVLTSDVFQLGEDGILLLYRAMYLIINLGALFFYMWQANFILSVLITCIFVCLMIFQKKINENIGIIIEKGKEVSSDYYGITNSIVENHEEHRRNGGLEYVSKIFKKNISELLGQRLKLSRTTSGIQLISGVAIVLNMATIFLLGAYFVIQGQMTLSELITFNMFANGFGNYLMQIPGICVAKKEFDISCKRVNQLCEIKTYSDYINKKISIKDIKNIKLNDVNFGYEEEYNKVILKFNTEFKLGNIYCIEGTNGSGKSTLIGLINGDYKLEDGKILINNCEVDMHHAKRWTDEFISTFSSEAIVYKDNILNNIIFDNDEDINRVKEVCDIVNLTRWLESLDNGIRTNINELKENLSDGQKQKIALARYLLSTKKVLLMDEMEKHLDFETKASILNYFNVIKNNHIIILVSHDSYIKAQSDRIILLQSQF